MWTWRLVGLSRGCNLHINSDGAHTFVPHGLEDGGIGLAAIRASKAWFVLQFTWRAVATHRGRVQPPVSSWHIITPSGSDARLLPYCLHRALEQRISACLHTKLLSTLLLRHTKPDGVSWLLECWSSFVLLISHLNVCNIINKLSPYTTAGTSHHGTTVSVRQGLCDIALAADPGLCSNVQGLQ